MHNTCTIKIKIKTKYENFQNVSHLRFYERIKYTRLYLRLLKKKSTFRNIKFPFKMQFYYIKCVTKVVMNEIMLKGF